MSARRYFQEGDSNNRRAVDYCFRIAGQGAAVPTFLEGDTVGQSAGTWGTLTRNGVGDYTYTSADPFPGVSGYGVTIAAATPAGQLTVTQYPPAQNANNTWSFRFTMWAGAVARELPLNDEASLWFRFRNADTGP